METLQDHKNITGKLETQRDIDNNSMQDDFRKTFGSPHGRRVVRYLMDFSFYDIPSFAKHEKMNDALIMEGNKGTVKFILDQAGFDLQIRQKRIQ